MEIPTTLEEWLPMEPDKGPPLPRFLDIYWPWYTTAPPTVYTCPYCGATFSSQAELDAHIQAAHPTPPVYTCPYCGATFSSQADLDAHIQAVHPTPPVYTCPYCGATFSSQAELDAHIQAAHPAPPPLFDVVFNSLNGQPIVYGAQGQLVKNPPSGPTYGELTNGVTSCLKATLWATTKTDIFPDKVLNFAAFLQALAQYAGIHHYYILKENDPFFYPVGFAWITPADMNGVQAVLNQYELTQIETDVDKRFSYSVWATESQPITKIKPATPITITSTSKVPTLSVVLTNKKLYPGYYLRIDMQSWPTAYTTPAGSNDVFIPPDGVLPFDFAYFPKMWVSDYPTIPAVDGQTQSIISPYTQPQTKVGKGLYSAILQFCQTQEPGSISVVGQRTTMWLEDFIKVS